MMGCGKLFAAANYGELLSYFEIIVKIIRGTEFFYF